MNKITLTICCACSLLTSAVRSAVLTFDDVPSGFETSGNYGGLNFNNFGQVSELDPAAPERAGVVSGANALVSDGMASMIIKGDKFTAHSAWITVFEPGVSVEILGFINLPSGAIYQQFYYPEAGVPTEVFFPSGAVNQFWITSSPFVIDDFSADVPNPVNIPDGGSTAAMLAAGLAGIAKLHKRMIRG